MGEWKKTTLGDAFLVNPPRSIKRGSVVPFIPMEALPVHARAVERVDYREFTGSGTRFQNGDTLIARITPCLENGKTAFISELPEGSTGHGSTEYIVLAGKDSVSDSLFGYYIARSTEFRKYAIGHMEGTSGRQRVPASAIQKFSIHLPSLPEQRAIAHILGSLDDKIELNRKRNDTLEAMARALFQDWFVDFGPVRAKMEGREPYLPAEIWELFPERLDEDGKPEGWGISTIGDCFSLIMGQSPPGDTYNDIGEGLPFFQGKTDFGFRYPVNRKYCSMPSREANAEDTLVSVRAPVGDINLAWERCCIGRGVAAIRHNSGKRSFTYHAIGSLQHELKKFDDNGTVFGSINKKQFEQIEFVEPIQDLIIAYEGIVGPIDDEIRNNIQESRSLAQLRDTLLPKLISGELRVTDVETYLEGFK